MGAECSAGVPLPWVWAEGSDTMAWGLRIRVEDLGMHQGVEI